MSDTDAMGHVQPLPDSATHENAPYVLKECYLPSITRQVHASNLRLLKNGDLLCAWFGGSQEGRPDISIYTSRLNTDSKAWTDPVKMTEDNTRSEQNPVIFQTPSDEVWLLYTSQENKHQDTAVVKKRVSRDGGTTWDPSTVLFDEPGTFIRQPLIVLDNGTWVLPIFKCKTEMRIKWSGGGDVSFVKATNDNGKTWIETEIPDSRGRVHMAIRQLKDKSYMGVFRSRGADNIYTSFSEDGWDWSAPQASSLPNNNSGICFDVLESGRIVVIYNHSSRANATGRREGLYDDIKDTDVRSKEESKDEDDGQAFWGAPRAPLCIGWSDDRGQTWKRRILEDGDGYCMTNNSEKKMNRELSYPSIAVDQKGTIHIAFTFWRQKIKYLQLTEDVFNEVEN